MARLSLFVILMTGTVLAGTLILIAVTLGYYTWPVIVGGAVIGFGLAWPVGKLISRRIKREDPGWDHKRDQPAPAARSKTR